MTFVLVSVVYAVAIGEPNFGIMGPFAVGLALFAMVFAGNVPSYYTLYCLHRQCLQAQHTFVNTILSNSPACLVFTTATAL